MVANSTARAVFARTQVAPVAAASTSPSEAVQPSAPTTLLHIGNDQRPTQRRLALHRGGLTPRQLTPAEQDELPAYGLGITNLVERATARADELNPDELRAGAGLSAGKVRRLRLACVAILCVTAYRVAFDSPRATVGPQSTPPATARVCALPNPSGLNAWYQPAELAAEFARLHDAVTSGLITLQR